MFPRQKIRLAHLTHREAPSSSLSQARQGVEFVGQKRLPPWEFWFCRGAMQEGSTEDAGGLSLALVQALSWTFICFPWRKMILLHKGLKRSATTRCKLSHTQAKLVHNPAPTSVSRRVTTPEYTAALWSHLSRSKWWPQGQIPQWNLLWPQLHTGFIFLVS